MLSRVSVVVLSAGLVLAGAIVGVMLLVAHDDSNAVNTIGAAQHANSARQLAVQACQEFYAAAEDPTAAHISRAIELSAQAAVADPAFARLASDLSATQNVADSAPLAQASDLFTECHSVGVR